MSELWALYGDFYKLPLEVSWDDQIARVLPHPGMAWPKVCMAAAIKALGENAFSAHEGVYFFHRPQLDDIAVRIQSDDPEAVLCWNPDQLLWTLPETGGLVTMNKEKAQAAADVRTFLQSFINATGLKVLDSIEELEAFYYLLMNYMMIWLMGYGRTVPMVFTKLFAMPLRVGWQQKARDRFFTQRQDEKNLTKALFDPGIRAVEMKDRVEYRRLECLPTSIWMDSHRVSEKRKLKELGVLKYLEFVNDRLKKMLPTVVEAYEHSHLERMHGTLANRYGHFVVRYRQGKVKRHSFKKRDPERDLHNLALLRARRREERARVKAQKAAMVSNDVPDSGSAAPDVRKEE